MVEKIFLTWYFFARVEEEKLRGSVPEEDNHMVPTGDVPEVNCNKV